MLDPLSVKIPLAEPPRPAATDEPVIKLLKATEIQDDYVMELDYSTVSTFLECPRKFENHAIRSREADRDQSALMFGGLFHKLEEARMRDGEFNDLGRQEMIERHFIKYPPPAADHRTGDRMAQVIKLYGERYASDGWRQKVYHDSEGPFIERPFKIELGTLDVNAYIPYHPDLIVAGHKLHGEEPYISKVHVLYTGRLDLLLEEPPLLWVVDRKTTSRGGREFQDAFRLSLQTRGYCWATQKITGREVAGLILDAAIVRALTKTGTGTELSRNNYFYSQDSLAEWEDNMKAWCADIIASLIRGYFPQAARSFMSPCSRCDYQENCALPRSQRAADLASDFYRDVRWNPMRDI